MIVTHKGIISKREYKGDVSQMLAQNKRENSKLENELKMKSLREENAQLKSQLKKKFQELKVINTRI